MRRFSSSILAAALGCLFAVAAAAPSPASPADETSHKLLQAVAVRIHFDAEGRLADVRVVHSSGDQALDRQAVDGARNTPYGANVGVDAAGGGRDYLRVYRFAPWSGDVEMGPLIDFNEHGIIVVRDGYIDYPKEARRHQSTGKVIVKVTVDPSGAVTATKVDLSSGNGSLDGAAVNAARSAEYLPAMKSGRPIESVYTAVYQFDFHRIEAA